MKIEEKTKIRILEVIPGLLVWASLIGGILLSFIRPIWAIYFIIAFDLYWLLRVAYNLIYLLSSWKKFRHDIKIDWFKKVSEINGWGNYFHLIILPTYKEPYEVVEQPFKSLAKANYPLDKFIVVLTGEDRDYENFNNISQKIKNNYGNLFYKLVINVHPSLPDELPGKGSNVHHAGKKAKELVDELKISYDKVIVSCFDIDTCPHQQYFACLAYKYINHPNPTHASYQPITIYNNNIWESNPIVRVVASSTTFWLFTDLARPERLFTFSSHSMSFKALVDVGFWDKTIVTEDSRIFLQCLVRYDGNYEVVPMHIPVYMNTVEVGNFKKTIINQYKQIRRWAWGVEHFPWMVCHFWGKNGNKKIPFIKKIYYLWNQTEGVYSWATAPLLIFLVGHLPLWLAGESVRQTTLFQNSPYILSYLMRFAMCSLIIIAVLYNIMLPPKPKSKSPYHYFIMLLQWVMVPVTLLIFGSIPSADAQTRLMLGGRFRLGFWVTEKKAASESIKSYEFQPRYE